VMAAEKVTPEAINFMAKYGRGLICLSLTEQRIEQLKLPLMVSDNTSPFQTAFTVSIEARKGVSTGISAADRAHTIRTAVAPDAKAEDLSRPGHVFPLRARDGGVLVRTGQTEGSVDLARLAGLSHAGVICEVMNEDGTMARRAELERFAKKHGLILLSVADLITYRLTRERLVHRVGTQRIERPWGTVVTHAFKSDVDPTVHLAMVVGDIKGNQPVLTRVHRGTLLSDVLDGAEGDGVLKAAFDAIREEGRGVLVYLRRSYGPTDALGLRAPPQEADNALRELGLGAQILTDLGLKRLRLLTREPKRIVGLESYGLEVSDQVVIGKQSRPARSQARRIQRVK
jgi:3,4-dihydroxy 2-butanone 4-phosphate synthase/GTP cyclohydrolase II